MAPSRAKTIGSSVTRRLRRPFVAFTVRRRLSQAFVRLTLWCSMSTSSQSRTRSSPSRRYAASAAGKRQEVPGMRAHKVTWRSLGSFWDSAPTVSCARQFRTLSMKQSCRTASSGGCMRNSNARNGEHPCTASPSGNAIDSAVRLRRRQLVAGNCCLQPRATGAELASLTARATLSPPLSDFHFASGSLGPAAAPACTAKAVVSAYTSRTMGLRSGCSLHSR
jgi:hypothetical protein